ncbi:MAG: hypothetical protein IJO43_02245 [Bacilli bacterium]|nr:hypothetical protein [Bacilli bacterium]
MKKFNQKDIIFRINLISGYVQASKDYFTMFESYLNDSELSDTDKLICIRNQYLEFSSNHSILLNTDKVSSVHINL